MKNRVIFHSYVNVYQRVMWLKQPFVERVADFSSSVFKETIINMVVFMVVNGSYG